MKLQVLTFLGFITAGSGDVFTHEESEDIKGYLETMMGRHNIPGLTIAVIKGNDSWTLPLGYADTAAKRAVTDETLFGIGSITKSITATLIAVMIDESEGKITFDTPVSELLGVGYEFPDDFQTRETTIKDVLSHRTGIAALNLAMLFGIPPGISREDFSKLVGMMTSKPFRGEMLYSNFMYMLAGHITEKVWGASWEENLKTKLFQKIGMTSTEAMSGDADITGDKYARPYVYLRGEVVEGDPSPFDISTVGPAGGLATNIKDKVKFMRFMLNKGKLENGTQLIKEATLQQLWQPVIPLPPFVVFMMERLSPQWPVADISTGYGMGWFKNVYRGRRNMWHAGGLHSYNSLLWLFPDSDMGLHISMNGPTSSSSKSPQNMLVIRQLKRIFRRMNLRRRGASNIQVVRRAVQQELNGNGAYLGCRSMRSRLLSSYGLSVPRDTVLQLQRELDPEGVDMRSCHRLSRRVYINKGPNYLVHIDGYDKLKPFGFAIHGAICGFSRKILWLEVSNTNNNPYVVASYFLNFIETLQGVPRCIRMDAGTENGVIEDMQKSFRWHHTDEMAGESSVIIGSSNSNQRIERWWRSMKEGGIAFWIDLFKDLQNTNAINFSDDFERDCLRYSCMDVIQADLNRIRDEWNTHLPRRVNGQLNGRPDLMYSMPEMYDAHDYKFQVCATDVADLWQCCTRPRPKGVDDDFQTLCDEIFRNQAMRPPSNSQECLVLFDLLTATLTH